MANRNNKHQQPAAELHRFPCEQCGAMLKFEPGAQTLRCNYCSHQTPVEDRFERIHEYDFHQALHQLTRTPRTHDHKLTQCDACGAQFKFERNIHSGDCPFCGTSIVSGTGDDKQIKPKSLLPFRVTHEEAQAQFNKWLKGLWFAPNKVKRYARGENKLMGVYIPYWTYDSSTETDYVGERGTVYYVNQRVRTREGGRFVTRVRRVPKIRWSPARGRVRRFFDDVLIGASQSLPRQITDKLRPWDLHDLVPYSEEYLSGFRSEVYQVEVDEGFELARQVMDSIIYRDIMFDIGGNHQRVHHADTRHSNTTFKHCLLPIWSAAFEYRDKTYRFVINGRTGKVQGERPHSYWKIALTGIAVILALSGLFAYLHKTGLLQEMSYEMQYQRPYQNQHTYPSGY